MECACGLFAPTYSQQKPVYYPASQSSMKLVGALVYHSPTERAPPLSPLAALSSAGVERFGLERRVIQHQGREVSRTSFLAKAIFVGDYSLTSSTSSIPLFYLFFRGRSF
jgi:hypothetical protein